MSCQLTSWSENGFIRLIEFKTNRYRKALSIFNNRNPIIFYLLEYLHLPLTWYKGFLWKVYKTWLETFVLWEQQHIAIQNMIKDIVYYYNTDDTENATKL